MNSKEFASFRKKLTKTQKEIALLLGISLKAVCSYEQGWRTIPAHVERQLMYLMARKKHRNKDVARCWDLRACPEAKKMSCPAWEFDSGDFCWFISGTICEGTVHKNWEKKIEMCKKCEVLKQII